MCDVQNFDGENMTAEIVGASAMLYPVLADFGAGMEAPILVYVDDGIGFQAFLSASKCFGLPPVHSLGEVPTLFRKAFQAENPGAIVIKYTRSRYSLQNLEEAVQYCSTSFLDLETRALVFVVTDLFVPESFLPYFAGTLYFPTPRDRSNLLKADAILKVLVDTVVFNQKQLRIDVKEIVDEDNDGIALFSAASVCIKMAMPACGYAKEAIQAFEEAIVLTLEEIREHWVPSCDPEAYVKAFACRLNEEIVSGSDVPIMLDRYHVYAEDCDKIYSANYYDENAYYFSTDFFDRICAPVSAQVGKRFFKEQLASAGLLECGNGKRNYFTSKVEVITVYGWVKQMHRVKVYRSLLEKNEDTSFVDLILMRKEDEDETEGNLLGENGWTE